MPNVLLREKVTVIAIAIRAIVFIHLFGALEFLQL